MTLQVFLINPPLSLSERYGKDMQRFGAITEPLGLAYIAGYLESKQIAVRIVDAQAEGRSTAQVVEEVRAHGARIVGITVLTPVFAAVRRLCRELKQALPEVLIVLGGPHCSALPEQTLQEIREADVVCRGEGELTMAEIARAHPAIHWSQIAGICYREGETIHRNPDRPFISDLDQIPPPARHLLPMAKYRLTASRVTGDSYCPTIIVARGCPFKCTYCSRIFGKSFRAHSIPRIISEIQTLIDVYRISQLNIEADTLTANRRFVTALCQAMIEAGFPRKIKWTCESRVDTVDETVLKMMQKAGCWQISYGVETGSQRLLDMISKGITLEQVNETFRITKQIGIAIRGFFMLGLPTETAAESLMTIRFAKRLDPYYAQFTLTVPYPGTRMFQELDRQGLIRSYDWSTYNTWSGWKGQDQLPYIPPGRTLAELIRVQKSAMQHFYLRPKPVWRFLLSIRSLDDIRKYAAGLCTLLKSMA